MTINFENVLKTPMKNGFGTALSDLGNTYTNIVCLGADITNSVGLNYFKEAFPDRFFSFGIAEQNIASVAAGLALAGKIPVFSTYAVFSALRTTDQIRVSICYNNLHVIIGGAHAGISVGADGATHQALEDIAIMRAIPNMTVLSPCDENQTKLATIAAITKLNSPCYIRYGREPVYNFTSLKDSFIIGKADKLTSGNDVAIIATGSMVWTAIELNKLLQNNGIESSVINIHTIKPIDKDLIIETAKKTNKIICIEEHQIYGGLGSAVAEIVSQHYPVKLKFFGINDSFGESGKPSELLKKYKLDTNYIYNETLKFIKD